MDWPIAPEARSPVDEAAERARESRAFFTNDDAPCDRPGVIASAPPEPPQEPRFPHLRRQIAVAIFAGAAVGLVAYGWATSSGRNGESVSAHVPPAANRAAAINLPPPNLLRPLSPQEATKENADRPFVSRPDTAAARFVLHADAADRERAVTCLAQAAYYEASGEGVDGERAVAQIVLNRVHHPGFPSTVCGVVYQGGDRTTGCQFSFVCDGSMQRVPVPALWTRSREIAEQALAGKVFAPVGHATHYHADYVLPYWADSLDKSVQLGHHIFYRLRSIYGDARAFSQRYGGAEPQVRLPGTAVIVAPTAPVSQQLANVLMGDGVEGLSRNVEKASIAQRVPLLVDSSSGTLLADSGGAGHRDREPKSSGDCQTSADRKQLTPLSADNVRASADTGGC
jgi:spore germination cell wall hydrolase CwlJ-like protein